MSNSVYTMLARQEGLLQEMQTVANNIANISTTGFKADRAQFAEFLIDTAPGAESLSMAGLVGQNLDLAQGDMKYTGGAYDLAIQGEGFFAVETGQGPRLTRAGSFLVSADGQLVDAMGNAVLDQGGGPLAIPQEANTVIVSADGTVSADGAIVGQVGVFVPEGQLVRESGTYFDALDGYGDAENPSILQGALEQSNVSPVLEIARMIEVQRAYETGQSLLDLEDERVSKAITTVSQG